MDIQTLVTEPTPYYKVQFFDTTVNAWVDIQRSYTSTEAATKAMPGGKKCRIMATAGKKRYVVG